MNDNLRRKLANNPHYNPSKSQRLNIQTQEVKREEVLTPEPQKTRKRRKSKDLDDTSERQQTSLDSLPEFSSDE